MIDIKNIISSSDYQNLEFHISNLVCDILIISEKISKLDKKTFYYDTIKEMRENNLIELKNKYVKVKNEYNQVSLKKLYSQKKKIKEKIEKVGKLKPGTTRNISMSLISLELNIVDDYIKMKSKFESLKNIKDYTNNELFVFFEA